MMVNEGRAITSRECCEPFDVSSASRDLGQLVETGQAARVGRGRSTRYVGSMSRL